MRPTLSRLAVAAAVASGGCATLIGFPDYGSTTTGTGGAGGMTGTSSANGASSTGTEGGTTACQPDAACYLGLDGTEGIGLCKAGTVTCSGSTSICEGDVRPAAQSCSGAASEAACQGVPGCTGQFRWAASGFSASLAGVAAGLDGTVAAVGNSTSEFGFWLRTFDARGRSCNSMALVFDGGGMLGATGVALLGAKQSPDQRVEQLVCGAGGNGRKATTVVVGNAAGMVTFANQPPQTAGKTDGFVAFVDPTDNVVWGQLFGSSVDDAAHAVATDPNGAVYITGSVGGPLTALPCTGTLDGGLPPGPGVLVARVEPDGSCGWVKVFPGSGAGTSIAVDGSGRVVVAGTLDNGSVDFDGQMLMAGAGQQGFIVRLTATGAVDQSPLGAGCQPMAPMYVTAGPQGDIFALCSIAPEGCGGMVGGKLRSVLAHVTPMLSVAADVCFSSTGSANALGVAADGAGNVVVLLTTGGPVDSPGFMNQIPVGGVVVFKLTPPFTGDYPWGKAFGAGHNFGPDMALAVDGMGDAIVVTNPQSGVTMDPFNLNAGGAVIELSP